MSIPRRRVPAIVAALLLSISAGGAVPASAWWGCDPGYDLQESGGRVRCYKPGTTQSQTPTCPPGTSRVQNLIGNQDRCRASAGPVGADGPLVCAAGFTVDVEPGWDMCRKTLPPHEEAPTRNVP